MAEETGILTRKRIKEVSQQDICEVLAELESERKNVKNGGILRKRTNEQGSLEATTSTREGIEGNFVYHTFVYQISGTPAEPKRDNIGYSFNNSLEKAAAAQSAAENYINNHQHS